MTTVDELRTEGERILRTRWEAAGPLPAHPVRDPRRDSDVLLGALLAIPSAELIIHRQRNVSPELVSQFYSSLDRRALFEPVSYILGRQEFWGIEFAVSPAVLIPRPETELVVERAVALLEPALAQGRDCTLLDIGTGSGAIVLSVMHELRSRHGAALRSLRAIGSDISPEALKVAASNAERHGLREAVQLVRGHLLEPLPPPRSATELQLVVSNPPYIADVDERPPELQFEPNLALSGGPDGLTVLTELVDHIERRLSQGNAAALIEIGQFQDDALNSLLREKSGLSWSYHRDLAQIPRVLGVRPGGCI